MHLWNDYEGSTLGGAFLLGTLLRTEGRSASFTTTDRKGRPAVIRLTEALNDEETIRARYRAIQAAAHPNLVAIEDFGDSALEDTPLTYVVTERTEESLAEILAVRRLTVEETGEVALSISGGLQSLHEHGLVHGLLEPASVLAVGEVIKLRTDCVRLAPEGPEGAQARYDDLFGLTDVLHRCLTQQHLQEASDALALPEPYASIVRQVLRGSWGLEAVTAELRRHLRPAAVLAPAAAAALSPAGAEPKAAAAASHGAVAAAEDAGDLPAPAQKAGGGGKARAAAPRRAAGGPATQLEDTPSFAETLAAANRVVDRAAATGSHGETRSAGGRVGAAAAVSGHIQDSAAEPRLPFPHEGEAAGKAPWAGSGRGLAADGGEPSGAGLGSWVEQHRGWVLGGAAALVGLVMLLLHFVSSPSHPATYGSVAAPAGSPAAASRPVQSLTAPMPQPAATAGSGAPGAPGRNTTAPARDNVAAAPKPAAGAPAATANEAAAPAGGKVWRVVAFTYNREDQAAAKARLIAEHHPDLHPVVFSRTGHAPYLVTLGGPLAEAQAAAMRQRARRAGVARDVYMQNYSR